MKKMTINWYGGRTTEKGLIVLTAEEMRDILYGLERMEKLIEKAKDDVDIYRKERDHEKLETDENVKAGYSIAQAISINSVDRRLFQLEAYVDSLQDILK